MATRDQSSKATEFVSKLVADPAEVPDVVLLVGYPGDSSEEDCTRLYLDTHLSQYVDIPEDDILFTKPVPPAQDPLGAVNVWIKRDAKVTPKSSKGDNAMFPTWTQGGGGAEAQGTFTPIPCGGGGGGTFTPVGCTVTPLCGGGGTIPTIPTIPTLNTRPPTFPTIPTIPTIPQTVPTLPQTVPTRPPTFPTFPTIPTRPTFPTFAAGGAAPQGTLTPIDCTVTPICGFAGGAEAQGRPTPNCITLEGGGGGAEAQASFTPLQCGPTILQGCQLTVTIFNQCQIVPTIFNCPPRITQNPQMCFIRTITPICQWPTIPNTIPTFPTRPTQPTFPTGPTIQTFQGGGGFPGGGGGTFPGGGFGGGIGAAPQQAQAAYPPTFDCDPMAGGGGGAEAQASFTPFQCGPSFVQVCAPSIVQLCGGPSVHQVCVPSIHQICNLTPRITPTIVVTPVTRPTRPTWPTFPTFPTTVPGTFGGGGFPGGGGGTFAGGGFAGGGAAAPQQAQAAYPPTFDCPTEAGGAEAQASFTPFQCGPSFVQVCAPSIVQLCGGPSVHQVCVPSIHQVCHQSIIQICHITTRVTPVTRPTRPTWPTFPTFPTTVPGTFAGGGGTFAGGGGFAGGAQAQGGMPVTMIMCEEDFGGGAQAQGTFTLGNCTVYPNCF